MQGIGERAVKAHAVRTVIRPHERLREGISDAHRPVSDKSCAPERVPEEKFRRGSLNLIDVGDSPVTGPVLCLIRGNPSV